MTQLTDQQAAAERKHRPYPIATLTIGAHVVQVPARPFSAAEYERMIETGVLTENDFCELIEGEIVAMSPLGSRHVACVNRLVALLVPLAGASAIVSPQNLIRLNDYSEPEPDIVLLKPRDDFYERALASPSDILALIEVADTTLDYDRTVKAPLYARNGIPEMWVVDLADESIEIYSQPSSETYQSIRRVARGDTLAFQRLPDITLKVDDILGVRR